MFILLLFGTAYQYFKLVFRNKMTRFARARGSKACNQKIPDEATPWSDLKQQVSQKKNDSEETEVSHVQTNWKEVINIEKKVDQNVNSVWCDFNDIEASGKEQLIPTKKQSLTKKRKRHVDDDGNGSFVGEGESNSERYNRHALTVDSQDQDLAAYDAHWEKSHPSKVRESAFLGKTNSGINEQSTKRGKVNENWSITGKEFRKSHFKSETYKRRKHDEGDQTLDVNGQKIVVTKLDGFYVRKEDADRIRELEKALLKRGVSKEEVRATVKKERRNAEKSLARQKKKVCFHCRKGGHNLSSCPKLNEGGTQIIGSGICYKCGSTEHSHLQCRVSTGQGYKFAVCFICKEEGHIAKQCPDNPRGLYPDGGACKLCGEVTHFKKDCPSLQKNESVTIGTIDRDVESLPEARDQETKHTNSTQKRKKKIIKFT